MKRSFSRRLANKVFRLINVKGFYENEKYLKKQSKQSKKEVNPPVTHNRYWAKHMIGRFNFFETKNNNDFSKVVIYFHGGGFISQPNIFHWNFLKKIYKETGAKIYLPIYPKAPLFNHKDCYNFLFDFLSIIKPNLNQKEIIFIGDSAGGNIALSFSLQLKDIQITKNILISPCLDLSLSSPEIKNIEDKGLDVFLSKEGLLKNYKKWAGSTNLKSPILSPINSNFKHLPPTTIFVGTHEILYPEALNFTKKALSLNKKIELIVEDEQTHAFPLHPFKESKKSADEIINLINEWNNLISNKKNNLILSNSLKSIIKIKKTLIKHFIKNTYNDNKYL